MLERIFLGAAIAATALTVALATLSPALWKRLSGEDTGPEAATIVALLLLAGIAAKRAFEAPRGARVPLLLLVAAGLFASGEEMSWGQRFFDYEPAAFFAVHNAQGEANLHNLLPPPYDVLLGAVILTAFLAAPALRRRSFARSLTRRGVPWPRWHHTWLLIGCFLPLGVVGAAGTMGLEETAELVAVLVAAAVVCRWSPPAVPPED